ILTDQKGQATLTAAHWYDLVEATKPGYARARAWIDQKILARHRMTLRLARGADRARLAIGGRVVDRAGRPVDGALVEAFGKPGFDGDGPAGAQTLSGVDGAFLLAALEDARYTLRATSRGEGGVIVDGVPAGKRDVELRLGAPTAALHGVVRDGAGKPITAFSVVAFPIEGVLGRGPELRATIIDPEGRYTLPLPTGHYAVAAAARGFARSPDRAVDVGEDGAELDFALRGGSRIFGRVVERVGGAPIAGADVMFEGAALQDGITVSSDTRSGADGSFAIEGVPSGRQSLNVQAAGHDGRILGALAVPSEGTLGPLTIDLAKTAPGEEPKTEFVGIAAGIGARPEGMVIISVAPGGGAADAGLVVGDIIRTIDGQRVGGDVGFVDAIQMIRGPEGTIVVMTVQRKDGSVQTIPVTRKRVTF
ncbi:MAG: carboxypeptidase regulatory-like domain-containing protein, partial [Polyangia bacterium]